MFSIQAYWSAHFILPAAVLKDLKTSFSRFLWKGPSLLKFGTKDAWSKVTLPYSEVGLDLKNLEDWNKAQILFKLWQIVNPFSNSFWAKWIKQTVLKDKHFWVIPVPTDCSWIWRNVLQLRPLAMQHISYRIGNDASVSLSFDPWLSHFPLASTHHDSLVCQSGLGYNATVQSIIQNSAWQLPISNHCTVMDFRNSFDLLRPCNSDVPDQILWGNAWTTEVKVRDIWQDIRVRSNQVTWHKIIWHNICVPHFSFVLWMAFHKGLRTMDILQGYGLEVDPICRFCHTHLETFSHLFFHCSYSFQVLFAVLRHCGWSGLSREWSSLIGFLSLCSDNGVRSRILYLGFAATVYYIWKERNSRIHNNCQLPARILAKEIIHILKCRLQSNARFQKVKHRSCNRMLVL